MGHRVRTLVRFAEGCELERMKAADMSACKARMNRKSNLLKAGKVRKLAMCEHCEFKTSFYSPDSSEGRKTPHVYWTLWLQIFKTISKTSLERKLKVNSLTSCDICTVYVGLDVQTLASSFESTVHVKINFNGPQWVCVALIAQRLRRLAGLIWILPQQAIGSWKWWCSLALFFKNEGNNTDCVRSAVE